MRKAIWFLGVLMVVVPAAQAQQVPDCAWGWFNGAGGVELVVNLCPEMLMRNKDGSNVGVTPKGDIISTRLNLSDQGNKVEYTYLLSPGTPVVLEKKGDHTWSAVFDPSALDPTAGAMVGNIQVRQADGTCIFVNLSACQGFEDAQPCTECVTTKPPEYKGKGEQAITFRNRQGNGGNSGS